ncbi:hypothetical protein CCAX7_21690 [Capsulimonas corticalis]|uniref:Uncharacterized protein n=1 Tax=Capsulimonas corticalis TaxID=2219043 RepID=A0A402D236_9BACT|nr:sodium:solute symporter [Capsulimonas corticalis]BDI30118.1 hypothetical protein CCAX7_21690 [Capsulimonas corticalis]
MNLSWIDWMIVIAAIVVIRLVSWSTRSLMRGVADFLSANRVAGRYLLTISGEMGNFGVITLVAGWQAFTSAGFVNFWWPLMYMPLSIVFIMTGWVFYRLRETRALTVGQFLEMRYSRRFRVFAGGLCWLSGIINFGIFPAVAARFLIYFCGLPDTFPVLGLHIATYPALMVADLGMALYFVLAGGQISVMVTECAQGMIACVAYVAIAVAALLIVPWHREVAALQMAPANASMLNPFHTTQVKDFNLWYYLIQFFISIYCYQAWLGGQGFMTSARNPHEQRMGALISNWRGVPLGMMSIALPLAGYTLLHSPHYAAQAASVNAVLHQISNPSVQNEMLIPVALAHLLPVGIKGLVAMIVVFLSFTCHDTYLHAWGSIFVQDVLLPLRNRPLEPHQQIRWLRWSIFFVAVFIFVFSMVYSETDKIKMFQAMTGVIWLAGAGSVMIGGLYGRFGTAAGAYCAMAAGGVLGIGGLLLPLYWQSHHLGEFPINGQYMMLLASLVSIVLYVSVSFATGGLRRPFNLEKMLHRGVYSTDPHEHEVKSTLTNRWLELLGMGKEFSRGDRFLAILYACTTLGTWLLFIGVCAAHFLFHTITDQFWINFWHIYLMVMLCVSIPVLIWFTIGGVLDIRNLKETLKTAVRDDTDDGRVVHEDSDRLGGTVVETPAQIAIADQAAKVASHSSE